ncbi:tyrosine-type recombinase/integrase [Microbacterium faecale]|uniref:tyrosine-type recombinase/integrase n=1 Tax=Microbacterium faecale TaxID=1804630 RepID=UPI001E4395A1|nr:tyrosine-type recombinase/integrase [Microbacterium faecale]
MSAGQPSRLATLDVTCSCTRPRHTGATWLTDAGIPLHVLQSILGHKSIETTRGYLHPDTRHLTDAAARANAFLDGHESHDRDSPVMPSRTTAPRR